ncbi:MAG: AbrB/MazE/SpoVT family DNA-binding domain-containing protein [Candidatus Vogelbacteria bacterium]
MITNTKIHKIGNSLGVYIPKGVAERAGMSRGTLVRVRSVGYRVIVEPGNRRETLQDILKRFDKKNHQTLIDFGNDVGREKID